MEGVSIWMDNGQIVLALLALIVISGYAFHFALQNSITKSLEPGEYFSLAIAGWMLPASLLSALWYILKVVQLLPVIVNAVIVLLFFSIGFVALKKRITPRFELMTLVLILTPGIFITLRLAFISKIILPLYFDSAQHYLYISNLMGISTPLATPYYHLGFHTLTAFISATLNTDIKNVMLVLGQVLLAITPISLFFITKQGTRSNFAGIFTILLASFGWYMPAHAVEWGKYPALASLPLIQFAISIAYLMYKEKVQPTGNGRWMYAILLLSVLVSVFFHSRSLVIFGIVFLVWIINMWRKKLSPIFQTILLFAFIGGIISQVIFIQNQDILKPLLDPYINDGIWITDIVLVLFFFANKYHSSLTFACTSGIFFLIGSIFIPINRLIGYESLTLLDRPFVEMILYLPFSLLGGLGLAGLLQYTRSNIRIPLEKVAAALLIGLVLVNAYINHDFYPSDCCVLVDLDDLTVIDWMDKNLPPNARILISTTELVLVSSDSSQGQVGGDAGIWILPLIHRRTFPITYTLNFDQIDTLDVLCKKRIDYIYVGGIGQSFDSEQIKSHTEWYKALLSMQKAGVYQVIGCS